MTAPTAATTPDPCTAGGAWGRLPGRSWSSPRRGRGTGWPALRCKRLGRSPGRLRGGPVRRPPPRSDRAGGRCPSHRRRTWSPSQPQRGRHTRGSPPSPHSTTLRGEDKRKVKEVEREGRKKAALIQVWAKKKKKAETVRYFPTNKIHIIFHTNGVSSGGKTRTAATSPNKVRLADINSCILFK